MEQLPRISRVYLAGPMRRKKHFHSRRSTPPRSDYAGSAAATGWSPPRRLRSAPARCGSRSGTRPFVGQREPVVRVGPHVAQLRLAPVCERPHRALRPCWRLAGPLHARRAQRRREPRRGRRTGAVHAGGVGSCGHRGRRGDGRRHPARPALEAPGSPAPCSAVGALLLSVAGVISIAEVGAVPSGVPPLRLDLPGRPASAAAPAVIARVGFAEAATGAVPHHGHRQAMLARKHALAHPAWSSAFDSAMSDPVNDGCSSPKAKAATSASSRSRIASS